MGQANARANEERKYEEEKEEEKKQGGHQEWIGSSVLAVAVLAVAGVSAFAYFGRSSSLPSSSSVSNDEKGLESQSTDANEEEDVIDSQVNRSDLLEYEQSHGRDGCHYDVIKRAIEFRQKFSQLSKSQQRHRLDQLQATNSLPLLNLRLCDIHHTQASKKTSFTEGRTVQTLIEALQADPSYRTQVNRMRVVYKDSRWWSIDNRRLDAFKKALPPNMEISVVYLCTGLKEFENKKRNGEKNQS